MAVSSRNWISCPLGTNLLLSIIHPEKSLERYLELSKYLKHEKGLTLENRIYLSHDYKSTKTSKNNKLMDFISEGKESILKWVIKNGLNSSIFENSTSGRSQYVLTNLANFQMTWHKTKGSHPVMTVYNTFGYTEDIKYEAKILELPLRNRQFKLVLLVPNEIDTLYYLFNKLINEGLQCAVQSIQPLFTAASELKAPKIEYQAESHMCLDNSESAAEKCIGNVRINEDGVDISCFTCIYSGKDCPTASSSYTNVASSTKLFLFAVVFRDIAIFTGQYLCK